jgi:hypothetical protein
MTRHLVTCLSRHLVIVYSLFEVRIEFRNHQIANSPNDDQMTR